jgi:aldehyde oxidoreductase
VTDTISVAINGLQTQLLVDPSTLVVDVLRDELGLTGTKVGCRAGDCGSCTVLVDNEAVCACLMPVARLHGRQVITVEGLADDAIGARLQRSFLRHGAAQCGFCTPAMLLAARGLLTENATPSAADVRDALGGVLCRCTGYRSIIEAVIDALGVDLDPERPPAGKAVGASIDRVDGLPKVRGHDEFGDDGVPADALTVKVIRSPHHRCTFHFGDLSRYIADHPAIVAVITAADVPGINRFGVIPGFEDQPVFAEDEARFCGEAVAAVVLTDDTHDAWEHAFPITWHEMPAVLHPADALEPDCVPIGTHRSDNVLITGFVARGDASSGLGRAEVLVDEEYTTPHLEHAYLEPEAGWAEVVDGVITVHATTQSPHMDRVATAAILGVDEGHVRIVPTAVGGGFGGKLDISIQPILAIAARRVGQPVRLVYGRGESMATTTKRHPSSIRVRIGANRDGRLTALDVDAVFNTGAYASWGPTVANRVPVHASGPYFVENYRARSRAVTTNTVPSGAFRGFGVPQVAFAQESALDELARLLGIDRLDIRLINALRAGQSTVTGQVFGSGVGFADCLEALRPEWREARFRVEQGRASEGRFRRGAGIAGVWYGCGNTSLSNPSTIKVGLTADGLLVLHQGAVDIGQGSSTVLSQIVADAIGVDVGLVTRVGADTAVTPDAGKTSASRQTYVSGRATFDAGRALRRQVIDLLGAPDECSLELVDSEVRGRHHGRELSFSLASLPTRADGYVVAATGFYDPPTTTLDANGQGEPYGMYGFGAQIAELIVDTELGCVELHQITAAYDVGRAVNPRLVIGQIEGGIAQGIGFALMEEYVPGRTDNLHDYLIPTIGDVPPIHTHLIESADPRGPYGAKGVGEHSLIATAPAILNALRDACGATITSLPATPERVVAACAGGR